MRPYANSGDLHSTPRVCRPVMFLSSQKFNTCAPHSRVNKCYWSRRHSNGELIWRMDFRLTFVATSGHASVSVIGTGGPASPQWWQYAETLKFGAQNKDTCRLNRAEQKRPGSCVSSCRYRVVRKPKKTGPSTAII